MTFGNWGEARGSFNLMKKKIIGVEPAAENDGVDIFEQAGAAAE